SELRGRVVSSCLVTLERPRIGAFGPFQLESGFTGLRTIAVLAIYSPSLAHAGYFNAVASTGIFRSRLPVAAKIALATAGTMAEVPHSPIPPGGSAFRTMWTSIAGTSFIRSIR